jgi:hypothetical protein
MGIAEIKKQATEKMAKSIDTLKHDLSKVRTGRAHAGLVDHLKVDYYGTETPIPQVANVTLSDARTIQIQPWDKKMVQAVEKAIRDSDLGVNPATSGDVIRVPMPAPHGGAPPRDDEDREARGRERQGGGAQHPPRRDRAPEGPPQGGGSERGRGEAGPGRRAEVDGQVDLPTSTGSWPRRNGN